MNNTRIRSFLDELLKEYEQTPSLLEQKEELVTHLTERVEDYMAKGHTYDQAFNSTINDLGDVNALVADMAPIRAKSLDGTQNNNNWNSTWEAETGAKVRKVKRFGGFGEMFTALSVFIYLFIGFMTPGKMFWGWGWVIIPISAIMLVPDGLDSRHRFIALTPFIYFLLGWFLGWWMWAWIIIPVSAILLVGFRENR